MYYIQYTLYTVHLVQYIICILQYTLYSITVYTIHSTQPPTNTGTPNKQVGER